MIRRWLAGWFGQFADWLYPPYPQRIRRRVRRNCWSHWLDALHLRAVHTLIRLSRIG